MLQGRKLATALLLGESEKVLESLSGGGVPSAVDSDHVVGEAEERGEEAFSEGECWLAGDEVEEVAELVWLGREHADVGEGIGALRNYDREQLLEGLVVAILQKLGEDCFYLDLELGGRAQVKPGEVFLSQELRGYLLRPLAVLGIAWAILCFKEAILLHLFSQLQQLIIQ